MHKFSSIEQFHRVYKNVVSACTYKGMALPTYTYIGSVKLHGTNAGVRKTKSGKIIPQSRNRILDVTNDNYGFSQFIEDNTESLQIVFEEINKAYPKLKDEDITLYGELVGQGIQSGVAVSQLPVHWVLFNMRVGEDYLMAYPIPVTASHGNIFNIAQIPLYEVEIDFSDPEPALEVINAETKRVEEQCPWGLFRGVEGVGEGIVWIPVEHPSNSDFWFKTKGEKHTKKKSKGMKASLTPEQLQSIQECLDHVLPDWRLEQGIEYLKENGYEIDHRSIGKFIEWIHKDILKEEKDTVDASGLEWKILGKSISGRARDYILDIINTYD